MNAPAHAGAVLRVATYNIHKGVRGLGPRKRLEIHNLATAVRAFAADLVFLQEVRRFHHGEARRFQRTTGGWPAAAQADFLAPEGYEVAYRTNAYTRDGEHGNALLSRWPLGEVQHHDVSDHRFEQRGLLHVPVSWNGLVVHAIVAHLGLTGASRSRQVQRLIRFIEAEVPADGRIVVAGDFNDWGERLDAPMREAGLRRAAPAAAREGAAAFAAARARATFPSWAPVFALDRVYARGLQGRTVSVPVGPAWARMSDHLPLVVELTAD